MNKKNIIFATIVLLSVIFVFTKCKNNKSKIVYGYITPIELPVIVPGFHFPEEEDIILSWMSDTTFPNNYDSVSVYKHAWGIWAGLTAKTEEVYQGDALLTFETWLGISEIQALIMSNNSNGGCSGAHAKKNRTFLERPNQFGHGPSASLLRSLTPNTENVNSLGFWVAVAYDPDAACFTTKNSILRQSVQNKYAYENGLGSIPDFPKKATTIKPVYLVADTTDNLIQIPVWSGPKAEAYPYTSWPTVVYADITNSQRPNKKLVPADTSDTNPEHIAAATCNLSDFINFKVDSLMAAHMNAADSTENLPDSVTSGTIAILVGMHVATKEIGNWTWQSYYWAPDPDNPLAPSSTLAASLRPSQLKGAASHYAVVAGYAMVLPNQPVRGGTNTGVIPVFSYNPYLESGFDSTFNNGNLVFPNGKNRLNPNYIYGSQTNCMSCHTLATPQSVMTINGTSNQIYSTVQYISNIDSFFINKVGLDFAWSIQGNTINDVPIKPRHTVYLKFQKNTTTNELEIGQSLTETGKYVKDLVIDVYPGDSIQWVFSPLYGTYESYLIAVTSLFKMSQDLFSTYPLSQNNWIGVINVNAPTGNFEHRYFLSALYVTYDKDGNKVANITFFDPKIRVNPR